VRRESSDDHGSVGALLMAIHLRWHWRPSSERASQAKIGSPVSDGLNSWTKAILSSQGAIRPTGSRNQDVLRSVVEKTAPGAGEIRKKVEIWTGHLGAPSLE